MGDAQIKPLTKREQRLARAIEGLSSRDMQRFLESIANSYLWVDMMKRLHAYADRLNEAESKS